VRAAARLSCCLALLLSLLPAPARAEPYLAVRMGLKCVACHVNPSGGGLRNALGNAFAQGSIAANALPEAMQGWNGALLDERLRLGGDFRTATTRTAIPGQPISRVGGTEQTRLYADVQLVKGWLGAYVDQQLAPGRAERQEAYVRLSTPGLGWYAKAGQFYLPFGWRLQDNLAFVRQLSGISMTVPDKGLELGHESGAWSIQLVRSDGPGNRGGASGHQTTAQAIWMQPWGRLGAAAARVRSTAGDRQAYGFFAGMTTGPVVWLGEVDFVGDAGYPEGRRRQLATLLEADWLVRQGHNLKLTSEYLDPDRRVPGDNKLRYSLVYEYMPFAFAQLRVGYRRFGGVPPNAFDNRRQGFVELHGFF
jgi:hypothetical protein